MKKIEVIAKKENKYGLAKAQVNRMDIYKDSLEKLLLFCERENWRGYDPYDGLNSPLAKILKTKYFRILLTQILKKSLINFRPLLEIKKAYNPKAMGLFASGCLLNYKRTGNKEYFEKTKFFLNWLIRNSIKGYSGYSWGYNFDWRSRAFFVPKGTPNVVCTSFIANAFLDAYEVLGERKYLNIARSSCNFILKDLNRTPYQLSDDNSQVICFSYTPLDKTRVHNANLLAAALLTRVYSFTREKDLLKFATKAVKFSVKYQNKNGSWYYGNAPNQRWIDNFHTGYNLVALKEYVDSSESQCFYKALEKGFRYYKENFFLKDGTSKYYRNKIYPIDIHSVTQSIVTFVKLKNLSEDNINQAIKIAQWGIENMQDERGFFYFQKHKYFTNKIPYMRWAQAWMVYALSTLIEALKNERREE